MKVELQSVYDVNDYEGILYRLLAERPKEANISHKKMPTWKEHKSFVSSRPYQVWYIIFDEGLTSIGTIYLTHENEIGIFIFKEYQRKGYANEAIKKLIEQHRNIDLLANIGPQNEAGIKLFKKFGFKHIQNTYKKDIT